MEPQENCKDVDDSLIFQIPVTSEEELDANVEEVIENTTQASLPGIITKTFLVFWKFYLNDMSGI